jgi:hypothetical protein
VSDTSPDQEERPDPGPSAGIRDPAGPKGWRRRMTFARVEDEPDPASAAGQRLRHRRKLFAIGIAAAAVLVLIALCAGAFGLVAAIRDNGERSADAGEAGRLRETACVELEQRLNRLVPPGAAGTPPARATAIQNENSAVRIYVGTQRGSREQDAWRQLLDARTAYAQALNDEAKSRTPAFYIVPRTTDGRAVTDQLLDRSPVVCAGPIRRLATPDL